MTDRLTSVLTKLEREFETLRRDLAALGAPTGEEQRIVAAVGTKLAALRGRVGAGAAGAAGSAMPAAPAPPPPGAAKGEATLVLGGASIESQSLGPPVAGPRKVQLWAMLAASGEPMTAADSRTGARLNELGLEAIAGFGRLEVSRKAWLALYEEVEKLSAASAKGIERMEKATPAIGKRTEKRGGSYVRGHSEAYIKSQRAVADKLRALGPLEEDLTRALADLRAAGLGKDVQDQGRKVDSAKGAVEAEKKRIEAMKKRMNGLFDLAIKAVRENWVALAEGAAKLVASELIDAIPTARLDQLQQELTRAVQDLERLEDELVLTRIEAAAAGMRGAAKALDDGRRDVLDAMADLRLAQKNAVEALSESSGTADAGKMIALRAKLLERIERTRQAIQRFHQGAPVYVTTLDQLIQLYKGVPGLVKMTPGVDPSGDYARKLVEASTENATTLASWKAYVADFQASGRSALSRLADTGDGGFLAHVNRVPSVLERAVRDRGGAVED